MNNVISSMAMTARQFAIRTSANQRECQIYREAHIHEQRTGRASRFKNSGRAQFIQANDRTGELRDTDERLD